MSASEQTSFLQGLAEVLNSKDIALPSFPDVVLQIRAALEDPTCTADRLAKVARTDPVLTSRLLRAVNSAFHNRAGIEIVDLDLAISRLGFEAVRNTAIALAIEQIFDTSQRDDMQSWLKQLWNDSVKLSSMCYVLAQRHSTINSDNAFLCGLLHRVGKLYIVTKTADYPAILGDDESIRSVMTQWGSSVGQSIIRAWGFPDDITDTMDASNLSASQHSQQPSMVDVVAAGKLLIDDAEGTMAATHEHPSLSRLGISSDHFENIIVDYELCVTSTRQSISA